jgi:hypothetical protein
VVREDFIFLAGRSDNPSRKTKREKDKVSVSFSGEEESPIQHCLAVSLLNGRWDRRSCSQRQVNSCGLRSLLRLGSSSLGRSTSSRKPRLGHERGNKDRETSAGRISGELRVPVVRSVEGRRNRKRSEAEQQFLKMGRRKQNVGVDA